MEQVRTDKLKPLHKRLLDYINDNNWTFDVAIDYNVVRCTGKLWTLNKQNGLNKIPIAFFYVNNNITDKDELTAALLRESSKPEEKQHNLVEFRDERLKQMLYMKSRDEISLILAVNGY